MSFEEGLARTIDWYRQNAAWVERVKSGEYRNYYARNYENRESELRRRPARAEALKPNPCAWLWTPHRSRSRAGGLARYTAELSRALAEQYPDDDFVLLSDQPFPMPAAAARELAVRAACRGTRSSGKWWLWGLDREMNRQGCGAVPRHEFRSAVPARRPSVLTLHDFRRG